jgi:hypothetical protein
MNDPLALDTPASSAADIANAAESPNAARTVAAANGQENLRFGNGSPLTIGASITLKPPAAFASGGIGIGGGAGLSMGGGAGISVSAGAGISADATPGISGLSRLSATEGAFAGLRVTAAAGAPTARLNTSRLRPQARSSTLATDRNARFQVGGKATLQGGAGLRADVGGSIEARGKLTFESS